MKIVLAGGRGRVGAKVAALLEARGVTVASAGLDDGVDMMTGEGLDEVFADADAIINVLNTNRFDPEGATAFFETSTHNLTDAGVRAGVTHHILLSIVGVGAGDASSSGYYLGKVAQERALRAGAIRSSIVRSTQFHSYVPVLADQHETDGRVLAPRSLIQPVELDEVAALLVEVATSFEPGGTVEIAGPDRFHLDDLLRGTLAAAGDLREIVTVDSDDRPDAMVPTGDYRVGAVAYPVPGIPTAD